MNSSSTAAETVIPSAWVLALPKAELHLHLEGAIRPDTLLELSRQPGHRPLSPLEIDAIYRYADFGGFLMAFKKITEYLRTAEDYELIAYRLMQELAAENVVHAEVYLSAGIVHWRGLDFDALFAGAERGRQRGEKDFGVSLLWIFDAVRHFGPEAAQRVVEDAVRHRSNNVAGIGLGGDEQRAPAELFREVYGYARSQGLHLTAHAGESAGPASIWSAMNLGCERIGHALHAFQDRELLAWLLERQTPLEICISSNLLTGCCRALEQHPVKTYFDLGLMVTLNSDDPAMFHTSLGREYQMAQEAFGFTDEHLRELARNSFEASFLATEKKIAFLDRIDAL